VKLRHELSTNKYQNPRMSKKKTQRLQWSWKTQQEKLVQINSAFSVTARYRQAAY